MVTCCQQMTMASIVIHLVAMLLSLDTWWEQFSGRWGGCLLTWAGRKQPDSDNIVSRHHQTSARCVASTLPLLVWLVMWCCIILVVLVWAGVVVHGWRGLLVGQVLWTGFVDGVVEELGGSGQTLMVGVELFVVVEVVCWCENLFWECKHNLLSYTGKRLVATQFRLVFPCFDKPCNWQLKIFWISATATSGPVFCSWVQLGFGHIFSPVNWTCKHYPQLPYSHHCHYTSAVCKLLHMDSCGPFPVLTPHKKSSFWAILNDKSNYGHVKLLAAKSDVFNAYQKVSSLWEAKSGSHWEDCYTQEQGNMQHTNWTWTIPKQHTHTL